MVLRFPGLSLAALVSPPRRAISLTVHCRLGLLTIELTSKFMRCQTFILAARSATELPDLSTDNWSLSGKHRARPSVSPERLTDLARARCGVVTRQRHAPVFRARGR
jgi:hypothetical protein